MKTAGLFLASAVFLIPAVSTKAAGNLAEVARSPKYAWSGVVVSKAGRVFVEFPLDLKTGNVRRLLSNSAVTKADPRRIPVAEGREMRKLSGEAFRVNADAIELSPDGRWLYFAPVDGPPSPGENGRPAQ